MSFTRKIADTLGARANPPVAGYPDIACRDLERPEVFFPAHGGRADRARAICELCPHQQECLDWALETRQSFGVWGGKSAEERAEMLKPREDA